MRRRIKRYVIQLCSYTCIVRCDRFCEISSPCTLDTRPTHLGRIACDRSARRRRLRPADRGSHVVRVSRAIHRVRAPSRRGCVLVEKSIRPYRQSVDLVLSLGPPIANRTSRYKSRAIGSALAQLLCNSGWAPSSANRSLLHAHDDSHVDLWRLLYFKASAASYRYNTNIQIGGHTDETITSTPTQQLCKPDVPTTVANATTIKSSKDQMPHHKYPMPDRKYPMLDRNAHMPQTSAVHRSH